MAENIRYELGLTLRERKYFVPAMRKKTWGRWDKWYLASLYANPAVKVGVCL